MLKRVILIVLGLSLVILGCSSPGERKKLLQEKFDGCEIIYRSHEGSSGVNETFIIAVDNKIHIVIVNATADGLQNRIHLGRLKLVTNTTYQSQVKEKIIIKETPTNIDILCIDNKGSVSINGTTYYLGKRSSYDESLLQPIRCLK